MTVARSVTDVMWALTKVALMIFFAPILVLVGWPATKS